MDKVCISERRDNGRRGRPGSYRKWPWADAPCLRRNESAKETIQIKNIHRYNIDINIIRIFISSRTNCFQWRQRKRGANLWRCCGCKLSLVDILGRIIHHAHEKQTRRDDATSWGGLEIVLDILLVRLLVSNLTEKVGRDQRGKKLDETLLTKTKNRDDCDIAGTNSVIGRRY